MNTQKFKDNGNFKFPVSTDTFDFMQKQILLASELSALAGGNVIIKPSTNSEDGICIYNGELMPLKKQADTHIILVTNTESISANGETFSDVRTVRYAEYANAGGVPATNFWTLSNLQTLKAQLDAAAQHYVPTGAIMMWSGAIANIPAGWALCNGQNGTPDLQGRFIVGAGSVTDTNENYAYQVGDSGGHNKVALTVSQMPRHNHNTATSLADGTVTTKANEGAHIHEIPAIAENGYGSKVRGGSQNQATAKPTTENDGVHQHTFTLYARGNGTAHENRPLYYALAYIMKII